ncbi:MAG: TonB-dependent receptor [Chloroherpetonaceae bacterium]|nr:TonB-dependent receptor [Chloroherpetonaceae bacterium]MDW8438179.1 TonB-dependent receptor [Chloroherpetonaceae bacterium]
MKNLRLLFLFLTLCASARSWAQGVTTSSIVGSVSDAKGEALIGAQVVAEHVPSGTKYGGVTQVNGRFALQGLRVGGPYKVTAKYVGYQSQTIDNVFLALGVAQRLEFRLPEKAAQVEEIVITAEVGGDVISPERTGAATNIPREVITSLPTIRRNFTDFTRLTPQAINTGFGSGFAGQDNRLNNITVDGSYLNNSFGLSGVPGGRAQASPISLEAVEQISVAIAPYDVRQAGFIGAGINLVTRSGANEFSGSVFGNFRDKSFVGKTVFGTEVGAAKNDFSNVQGGFRVSGPILKDKLFFFIAAETEQNSTPFTFRARRAGEQQGGDISRPTFEQMQTLRNFLRDSLNYETGPFEGYNLRQPQSLNWLIKLNYNISDEHKLSLRYNGLDAKRDVLISNSASLGFGARVGNTALSYENSNYIQFDRIQSVIAELNSTFGRNFYNQIIAGYTYQNEDRGSRGRLFPLVEIQEQGATLISFGFEPFTPSNQLSYSTFQFQENLTYFLGGHAITAGVNLEHYRFRNVFFPGSQSVYVYNSLDDWYRDARGFLENPNRTTSPVTLRRFQYRYSALPGGAEPVQPLRVWYPGVYLQDEWQVSNNLRLTAGLRVDAPFFEDTAYDNPLVRTLEFRDGDGKIIRSDTKKLPDAKFLISPRLGFNWNVLRNDKLQVRGGTGIFTGRPAFVWISNQIGNNGVLTGFEQLDNTTTRPFNPNTNAYRPANPQLPTSIELATVDPNFRFPQIWRTNLGIDYRLPYDIIVTLDAIYTQTINGIGYINANLKPATRTFAGPDKRLRYDGGTAARINPNVTSNVVLVNSGRDYAASFTAQAQKSFGRNWYAQIAYTYTDARSTVNPGSIALGSWTGNAIPNNPNKPPLSFSSDAVPHRFIASGTYRIEYAGSMATQISIFFEAQPQGRFSYVYAGDMNGDGVANNDLIYVPRSASELRFLPLTVGTGANARTFSPQEQAAAFDAFIEQDPYLRTRRGKYAERNGALFPWVYRADLSVLQEFFLDIGGRRNTLQVRADVFNFFNLISDKFGAGWQRVDAFPLSFASVGADGVPQFRMRTVNNQLLSQSFQRSATLSDLWSAQLSVRYIFN